MKYKSEKISMLPVSYLDCAAVENVPNIGPFLLKQSAQAGGMRRVTLFHEARLEEKEVLARLSCGEVGRVSQALFQQNGMN